MIKTNFLGDEVPKGNKYYACIACITIDSVMRIERKMQICRMQMQIQKEKDKNDQIDRS